MADVNAQVAANRDAVRELVAAAEQCAGTWTTPPAPGKWSPSQVVEHVARSLDEAANVVAGAPSKFPKLPFFVRPLVRGLLFNRVLRNGGFPKARTSKPFDPADGPASPADARVRLEAAVARFDQACRAKAATGQKIDSATFGAVSVEDYARFMAIHTHHHRRQIPGAQART